MAITTPPSKKPSLPTDDAAFKSLDARLGQEMARCARDYDDARAHLKTHHGKMQEQEAALVKQIAALQGSVDGLLDGTGPGLTKAVAKDCLKYLELNAQLHKTRQAQRLSYGATVDAGQQRLGRAIGDPGPSSVPGGTKTAKSVQFSELSLLKGVNIAMLFKGLVAAYTRYESGRAIYVRAHEDSRTKHPIFYSTLHHVLHTKMQHAAPADQVRGMVRSAGISPEETQHMGLDAALDGKGVKVYKHDLMEDVGQRGLQVTEVRLGAGGAAPAPLEWEQNKYKKRLYLRAADFTIEEAGGSLGYEVRRSARFVGEYPTLERAKEAAYEVASGDTARTKYSAYTLPGGNHYRELLLTLPDKRTEVLDPTAWVKHEYDLTDSEASEKVRFSDDWQSRYFDDYRPRAIEESKAQSPYLSSHWDEKNVLGHLRLADHTDMSGDKVLVAEELQSDWHQDGRKKGYRLSNADAIAPVHEAQKVYEAARDHFEAMLTAHGTESDLRKQLKDEDVQGERHVVTSGDGKVLYDGPHEREALLAKRTNPGSRKESDFGRFGPGWESVNDKLQAVFRARKDADAKLNAWHAADEAYKEDRANGGETVPDAPFKKNWHELLFKRALHEAVEGGYDKLAWPTGAQQADRYDLSKQIESINYHVLPDGKYSLHARAMGGGTAIPAQTVTADGLDDVVGKELADKMRRFEGSKTLLPPADKDGAWTHETMGEGRELSGDGLKVGGEGMKGFYDGMLPSYVSKYVKKWGGKVDETRINTGANTTTSVHSVTITPEMREAILRDGQPLFGSGGMSKGVGSDEFPDTGFPLLLKAIEGGNWDKGKPSYLSDKPGHTLAPKRPMFAEGLPRSAATAAMNAGMTHSASEMTGLSTRVHTFHAQQPNAAATSLHSSLTAHGYKPMGEATHAAGVTAKYGDKAGNTHTFHIKQSSHVGFPAKVTPPAAVSPPKPPPSFKMPKVSMPKIVSSPAASPSPLGKTPEPKATQAPKAAPAPPVNHLDSAGLADSISANVHEVQSRTVKPIFGKPQEQHAHLMSHANPKLAIAALHAHLAGQGKVGAIHEQRVPHASGGMAHLYSFDHTDHTGAKHTIHMMRTATASPSLKPKNGASPLPSQSGSPARAPKSTPKQKSTPKTAPASPAPSGKAYDPGTAQTHEAFTHGFIQHHAKLGTLPDNPKQRDKMLSDAYSQHTAAYPHPSRK